MRVLIGLTPPPEKDERDRHVREVVTLFLSAYRGPSPG
jgi:hypothetical protein